MAKAKILVCCHKKDIVATEYPYYPIHVGKALSDLELNMIVDNTGNNISHKNKSFCELTGIYWAWKNLKDTDIIGLCHYRRYFDFHNLCKPFKPYSTFATNSFENTDLSIPDTILNKVSQGTVIVSRPENYPTSVLSQFNNAHSSIDMNIVREIIKQDCDDKFSKAVWDVLVMNNKVSLCNMFIMNWRDFDNYCTWLFHILEKAESLIDISHYSTYQHRIYGFLAERLLNVWLAAEKKETLTYPMILFSDNYDRVSCIPSWKYGLGCAINNSMNFIRKLEFKFNLTV